MATSTGAARPAALPLGIGDFGGYQAAADVHSIGASWTVPRVISAPRDAATATWIGVQGPSRTFIQVGTEEATEPVLGSGSLRIYDAWWADTASHDRARALFRVLPGDEIVAGLRHEHESWLVDIRDVTSGKSAAFITKQEGRGPFNVAEWTQERSSGRGLAYPHISQVRFRHLRLNGARPDGPRLLAGWLSTPEGLLAPTPLSGDAFALRPARISAAGAQYLRIAAPEDAFAIKNAHAFDQWLEQRLPWHVLRADSLVGAQRIDEMSQDLDAVHWPPSAQSRVEAVVQTGARYARLVDSLPATEPRPNAAIMQAWSRSSEAAQEASHALRRVLGLPDPT